VRQERSGTAPTVRGWAFAVVGGAAVVAGASLGRPELFAVGAFGIVLMVASLALVLLRTPTLEVVQRLRPPLPQAGSSARAALSVRNVGGRRGGAAHWSRPLPWPADEPSGAFPPLAAGESVEIEMELAPPRRGSFLLGPTLLVVEGAFGLARARRWIGEETEVTVVPSVVPLGSATLPMAAGQGEASLVQRRAVGDEDDVITREYRRGDAMRRVHWRSTARHGELMVRQEEQRSHPEARILVDTLASGHPDGDEGFEWMVSMLASAALHLRSHGFEVRITETGTPQLSAEAMGDDTHLLIELAHLDVAERSDLDDAVADRAGIVVALAAVPDDRTVDWMLRQTAPGQPAVVFLVRPTNVLDAVQRGLGEGFQTAPPVDPFVDAGWTVVPLPSDEDPAHAWRVVSLLTENGRG
jgi:uncharacterized protein (DUF58 family)